MNLFVLIYRWVWDSLLLFGRVLGGGFIVFLNLVVLFWGGKNYVIKILYVCIVSDENF